MEPSVAIVIPAYNGPDQLARCLASLEAGTFKRFRVFLIDNSTTDAVEQAFARREDITYRRNRQNLGFCGANNVGISLALDEGYEYVLLLNHDTILDPDCLARLVGRAAALQGAWLVTGKIHILPDQGRLWYGGGYFDPLFGAGRNHGFNSLDDGRFDHPGETTYATGCCLLIPSEAFRKAGMLNERMFMYLDDIEFCLRAAKAGFRIFYEPAADIYHEMGTGAELQKRPGYYLYFSIRNKPLVAPGGWYGAYLHFLAIFFAIAKMIQFSLVPGITDRVGKLKALAWGAWDSLSREERYRRRFPGLFRPEDIRHSGIS